MKWWGHLRTITAHKRLVRKYCFRLGLYRQGLLHDLSKYSPTEFRVGAKYFQGNRSPNEMERLETGVSSAWLHHKGRNKHHLEYWIDYDPALGYHMGGMEMPVRYVAEMFCDRVAASRIYQKDKYTDASPWEYAAADAAGQGGGGYLCLSPPGSSGKKVTQQRPRQPVMPARGAFFSSLRLRGKIR